MHPRTRLPFVIRCLAGLTACLISSVHAGSGADPEHIAVQLRDKAMRGESVAWEFVSELTTRFGPRPAGSAAEQAAAKWAAEKLRSLGFENVHIESFPMTAWVRGEERARIVAPFPQPLAASALGGAPPTPKKGIEGEIVRFETLDDLLAAPAGSLTGKIAFVSHRMVRTQTGAGYGIVGRARAVGPAEAAKRGAIAFLLRSVGTDSHRMPHTGTTRYVDGRVPIPAFALSAPDADQIDRLLALGERVRVHLFSGASYIPNAQSQNVIAEVRGAARPDEVIVLGAHLDSWDQGTGAIDDAAGAAIITAAAKLIRDLPQKPRRTLRVVLYGSEEVDQPTDTPLGNRVYVLNRKNEIDRHVLAGESDMGADRIYAVSLPAGAAESEFGKILMRVLTPIGVLPSRDPPGRGGVDIAPLVEAGVPAFVLHQDGTRYFDYHHTPDDTLDKIDRAALDQNVAAWAALIWLAADSDVDFRALAAGARPNMHYDISAAISPQGELTADVTVTLPAGGTKTEQAFVLGERFALQPVEVEPRAAVRVEPTDKPIDGLQKIIVTFDHPPAQSAKLRFRYRGPLSPGENFGRLGFSPDAVELALEVMWLPFPGEINERFTVDARLHGIPEDLAVVAQGEIERTGEMVRIRRQVPDLDFPVAAVRGLERIEGPGVEFYVRDPGNPLMQVYQKHAIEAAAFLQQWLGPIPGGPIRMVAVPRQRGGAYARVGYTVVTERALPEDMPRERWEPEVARSVSHEFAHAWWSLGDPMTEHYWLTESLAEYSALRYVEAKFGSEPRDVMLARMREAAKTAGPILGGGRPSSEALYGKGPVLLFELEQRIGRDAIDRVFARLGRDRPRLTSQFFAVLAEQADADVVREFEAELRRQ